MSVKARFELGETVATPGAIATFVEYAFSFNPGDLLNRHISGDWGNVDKADAEENELSVREGARIVSIYGYGDAQLWVITEADRSVTTILRPDEY